MLLSLDHFTQDLRYGVRSLLRTPGFAAVAVVTLALGIGANTAIFSVVNSVLLRPLAYKNPDRLVTILHDGSNPVAPANYLDWRDQSRSFDAMAAAEAWGPNLTGGQSPEHLRGLRVTQNLLPMLGVEPMLGRLFVVGEDETGREHEVVLAYSLWQRLFEGSPDALGKSMHLNGEDYTVIGVMPPQFKFAPFWATHAELWAPLDTSVKRQSRGGNSLRVFARLKPSSTLDQARAEIATTTARLEQQYPGTNRRVQVTPLKEKVVGKIETSLLMMLGACSFVLLIACANVAHMVLARTSDRRKEIAVRTALGATRARVARQFLTENLLLALLGAAGGAVLVWWGVKVLVSLSPPNIPRVETVTLDGTAALFLLGITLVTAVVFGSAPAMQSAVRNLNGALKEGGRAGSDGAGRSRFRSFLVASEFALAFMLLIGAGLMIRSFTALQAVNPGFNPHNVLSLEVSVAGTNEAEPGRRAAFYRDLLNKVRSMPGVESAGAINHVPLIGDMWSRDFRIEGRPAPLPGESPGGVYRLVMPGYLQTMQIPLRKGRDITAQDGPHAPKVVIVNERAAQIYWPGQDAIGKRITLDNEWLTVAGVAANAKQLDWAAKLPDPEIYLAAEQNKDFMENPAAHFSYITLVVRTAGNPADLSPVIKNAVWSFDRNLPISQVITLDRAVADINAQPRFEVLLLGVFGAVALILASVGIYGVMSYSVSRRTREIGIRMSLGANRTEVLRMVVQQGMVQTVCGTVAGIAGALSLGRLMSKLLYGVQPTDLATFIGVSILLGFAALLATLVPARRATRIDPTVALREE
jgi:putative ABC transport system permease protein